MINKTDIQPDHILIEAPYKPQYILDMPHMLFLLSKQPDGPDTLRQDMAIAAALGEIAQQLGEDVAAQVHFSIDWSKGQFVQLWIGSS